MDADLLKTFLEVNKTRHFGKAAENLFITQSAVSARIRQLEEILGVQLFYRDRKNIKPTASGEKLINHARNIISMWNRVKLDVASSEHGKLALSVGAVSSLWDIYMQKWLREIEPGFSEFLVTCNVVSSENIHTQIVDGTLDLAFTYEPPPLEKIRIIKTIPIRFLLVSTRENIDMASAINSDYIYVDWGTPFSMAHSQICRDMTSPKLRLALGRIARDYLVKNGGSAYLPTAMVKRDIEKKRLFKVRGAPAIERDAYLILNEDNEQFDRILSLIS